MSIRVGAAILDLLTEDQVLTSKVGDKIYPIQAMDDTTFPYIAYRRKALIPAYTKQTNSVEDSVFIDIAIVAESYSQTIGIANDVLRVLDRKRGVFSGVDVTDIRVSDSEEQADEVYMQRLEFEIFINKLK